MVLGLFQRDHNQVLEEETLTISTVPSALNYSESPIHSLSSHYQGQFPTCLYLPRAEGSPPLSSDLLCFPAPLRQAGAGGCLYFAWWIWFQSHVPFP